MSVTIVNKNNFQTEVLASDKTVLLDFWAPWCGPCKMISPILNEIAAENNSVKVVKVNVDEERELASQFNIMSIPTLVVIKNGKVTSTSMGLKPKHAIEEMLK